MSGFTKSLFALAVVCFALGFQAHRISTKLPRIGPDAHRSESWHGISKILMTGMFLSAFAGVVSLSEDARKKELEQKRQ